MEKFFEIKDYPNDIYNAVGQIIKSSQEFEQVFKELARKLKVSIKDINISSLNRINKKLEAQNLISKEDYNNLSKVIEIRNRINHEFFLNDFLKSFSCYEEKISTLNNILNVSQFAIFEATDVVNNKLDKLNGDNIMRPTIFD